MKKYISKEYLQDLIYINEYPVKKVHKKKLDLINKLLNFDRDYKVALKLESSQTIVTCECEAIEFVYNLKKVV